ncbi:MAG: hypothetical protein C4547_16900 [Phycisphaerales bacterium]|nr:MAG: hypothetical protein C4547_16900 [Phycisphaerales bacterium]
MFRICACCTAFAWCAAVAGGDEFVFDRPSDDRWHYWVNFTPGTRAAAPCFGAAGNVQFPEFNDRDGIAIIVWDTSGQIRPGRGPDSYDVARVRVTMTNLPGARWQVDLTPDEWFTFDLNRDGFINKDGIPRGERGDTDGESDDEDPGRAVELFGMAFGSTHSYHGWNERSRYIGAVQGQTLPRDPFPFVYQDISKIPLHVEDNVKGLFNERAEPPVAQFTPVPWAVGVPLEYRPGRQEEPFDIVFDVDLELSDGSVRRYFQEQLDGGRVFVAVTSLQEIIPQGDPRDVPNVYMKEGVEGVPRAKPGVLEIVLGAGAIPCEAVKRLSASCRRGTLKARLVLRSADYDGREVTFSVNGEEKNVRVKGRKAKLKLRDRQGTVDVCLVDPPCPPCRKADCGG